MVDALASMLRDHQSSLIALCGALLGAWLGAHISRRAGRELLQQQAKSEFAATFSKTIAKLYFGHEQEAGFARDLLNSDFQEHYRAYQRLRAVLGPRQRAVLDRHWDSYAGDKQYALPEERDMYRFAHLHKPSTTHEQNMAAISHVNSLLYWN